MTHEDVWSAIEKFAMDQKKDLYVKMQKAETREKAIQQWDMLEEILAKLKDQNTPEEYINRMYNKVKTIKEKYENER